MSSSVISTCLRAGQGRGHRARGRQAQSVLQLNRGDRGAPRPGRRYALVLFNRFLQPDVDPEQLVVLPRVNLSSPSDGRLPRTGSRCCAEGSAPRSRRRPASRSRPMWRDTGTGGRRCGDQHLGAAARRTPVRPGAGRRARHVDGAEGVRLAGWIARDARGSGARGPGGGGARRLRLCDAGSQPRVRMPRW